MMHAILLAAGMGQRLGEITGGGPKCLLPFAGQSLLERHLLRLAEAGVHRLTIVIGCEAMQIEQALGARVADTAPEMSVDTVLNPEFRAGSALSVLAARAALSGGDDILLMDADVLYDARLIEPLCRGGRRDAALFDRDIDLADPEPVKLCLRADAVVGFDKTLPVGLDYDTVGESVGFFRLTPATAARVVEACERASAADAESPYEPALGAVMSAEDSAFVVHDVTGLPWIEIDTPDDLDRAYEDVLPRLAPKENV